MVRLGEGLGGGGVDNCFDPWPQSHTVMTARAHGVTEAGAQKEQGALKRGLLKED